MVTARKKSLIYFSRHERFTPNEEDGSFFTAFIEEEEAECITTKPNQERTLKPK